MGKNNNKQHQMHKWASGYIVSNIHISTSFSSSSANNLEVFFMFQQAKNRQEGKAQGSY